MFCVNLNVAPTTPKSMRLSDFDPNIQRWLCVGSHFLDFIDTQIVGLWTYLVWEITELSHDQMLPCVLVLGCNVPPRRLALPIHCLSYRTIERPTILNCPRVAHFQLFLHMGEMAPNRDRSS